MIKLAIVSPCYNEEEVLEQSAARLTALFDELVGKEKISADSFVLFVNDGSKDRTWNIIKKLHKENPYVKGMNLARNVGHQSAIMAGMMTAKDWSDAVVTIDADLQDDLNAIEEMIDAYTAGYDVVYGVKVSRQADPLLKRLSATAFYKLQRRMGVESIYNHADFRFLSRRVLEQLSHYQERNLYLRGIIPLLGFPSTTVDDVIRERTAGSSKYSAENAGTGSRRNNLIFGEADLWHCLFGYYLCLYQHSDRFLCPLFVDCGNGGTWLGLSDVVRMVCRRCRPDVNRCGRAVHRKDI